MQYDVIIAGGGLVGAGLALALGDTGLKTALIDAKPPTQADTRLFALNHGSCAFLRNIHAWDTLESHASPIQQVKVSRERKLGILNLHCEEMALPQLGHVIPACEIEATLNKKLTSLQNCTLFRPAQLETLQSQDEQIILTVKTQTGQKILQSPLVIGADGTTSTVRAQLGIAAETFDYGQSALVTRTTLHRSHQHIAHERFLEKGRGALAMLPLLKNQCATIWSGDHDFIARLLALPDETFLDQLQQAMGYRLGRFERTAARHSFPLKMVRARQMCAPGVLLLGNAAHTLHPIAAQGFNLALYEVSLVAEFLHRQKTLPMSDLMHISAQLQKQQAVSFGVSHRLGRSLATQSLMINGFIQAGMTALNLATPVKRHFLASLTGRKGYVPRLLMDE